MVAGLLAACGGSGGGDDVSPEMVPQENIRVLANDQVRSFRPASPYAPVLKRCLEAEDDNRCTLSELPYIGMEHSNPTVEDILARTVVTHDWMGVRFGQLLAALPADILTLFKPITAILIGSEVRPSGYSAGLGRMRIDPVYLWMGLSEKLTISTESDFRAEFGADLQFRVLSRFMQGDDYAFPFTSIRNEEERPFSDLVHAFARLMYHELGHANDYIPPEVLTTLSPEQTPAEAVDANIEQSIGSRLYADEALTIQRSPLYSLARVRWRDTEPTDEQKAILGDAVGALVSNEGKPRFYSFLTIREDVATLFAAAMMKYHYNIDLHMAFVNKNENIEFSCDLPVEWGARNRLASPLVLPRAQWVTEQILGSSASLDQFFSQSAGVERPLAVGTEWCASRFSNPVSAKRDVGAAGEQPVSDFNLINDH
jgi:hypothetical protein